ncbi:MAG: hypothetical protein NUW37_08290 [Planctomycetes bacterium]|nr:hypothetical protein [Planctomycetota bacterium]
MSAMDRVIPGEGRKMVKSTLMEQYERGVRKGEARGELKGILKGVSLAIEAKFGPSGRRLIKLVSDIEEVEKIEKIGKQILKAETVSHLKEFIESL